MNSIKNNKWTCEENKLFENALSELNIDSPTFFQTVMQILPWKTLDEIKSRYEELINDVLLIEASPFSDNLPISGNNNNNNNNNNTNNVNVIIGTGTESKRKGIPWTEDEHKSFLQGLQHYGKGEWRNIAKYYVASKTACQVASHAQKYFRRVRCKTPLEKRRYSIHDIRILNNSTTIVRTAPRQPNYHVTYSPGQITQDPAPLSLADYTANYSNRIINQDPIPISNYIYGFRGDMNNTRLESSEHGNGELQWGE